MLCLILCVTQCWTLAADRASKLPQSAADQKKAAPAVTQKSALNEEQLEALRKAAEKGDANAQYSLGLYYELEERSHPSMKGYSTQAYEWYRKAALQGNADAEYKYGSCFYFIEPIADDAAKISRIFDSIIKSRQGIPKSNYGPDVIKSYQHIENDFYLIRHAVGGIGRLGTYALEAAHLQDVKNVLPDDTELFGYLIHDGKTYSYTNVMGAKQTVKLSVFRNNEYPFTNVETFKNALKHNYGFGSKPVQRPCKECYGGTITQNDEKNSKTKCRKCKGTGQVPIGVSIYWNIESCNKKPE
jgi:hypothetical protein